MVESRSRRRAPAAGPPLTVLLVGMIAFPMIFVTWVANSRYEDVVDARSVAEATSNDADEIALIDDLRIALLDERSWKLMRTGAAQLGIPIELVNELVGVDLEEAYLTSVAEVDDLTATAAGQRFEETIASAREIDAADLDRSYGAYEHPIDVIAKFSRDLRTELEDRVGSVPQGSEVVRASRMDGAATTAEFEHNRLTWSYLVAIFATLVGSNPDYVDLVKQDTALDEALAHLESNALEGTRVDAALYAIAASPDVMSIDDAVDAAVAELFDPVTPGPDPDADPLAEAMQLVDFLAQRNRARALFADLRLAADQELNQSVDDAVDAAEHGFKMTLVIVVGLGLASVLAAVALARYIRRPMADLVVAADELGDGLPLQPNGRGPREVRTVDRALADASRRLLRMERLEHEVTFDDLTAVRSRRAIRDHLARLVARAFDSEITGAVAFIDVDLFKEINDTHGHAAGDVVLRTVADRIAQPLGRSDVIGRSGGDEFIVVARSVRTEHDADQLAARIVEAVAGPVDLRSVSPHPAAAAVDVSVSVGVTVFGDLDTSAEDVLARADFATYEAKSSGRNRAVFASSSSIAPISPEPSSA